MKKILFLLFVLLFLFTVSCATGRWYKQGATDQDYKKDDYECTYQSEMYGMSATPNDTAKSAGAATGRGIAAGIIAGTNYKRCMQARGWQLVKK